MRRTPSPYTLVLVKYTFAQHVLSPPPPLRINSVGGSIFHALREFMADLFNPLLEFDLPDSFRNLLQL